MKINDFSNIIKQAVEAESDHNWNWYVRSIDEEKILIRWGYFDYLNEPKYVVVRCDDLSIPTDEEYMIVGYLPCGSEYTVLVGTNCWDDCDSLEEGIKMAIHGIIALARHIY